MAAKVKDTNAIVTENKVEGWLRTIWEQLE